MTRQLSREHVKSVSNLFNMDFTAISKTGRVRNVNILTVIEIDWHTTDPIGIYGQVSNISHTLVGNEIFDHSDEVGASPVGVAPTTSSSSAGLIGLGKDNCKTRR